MELEIFDNLPEIDQENNDPIVEFNNPEDKATEVLEQIGVVEEPTEDSEEVTSDEEAVGYYNTLVSKGFIEKSEDFKGTFDSLGEEISKSAIEIVSKSEDAISHVAEMIYTNAPDTLKKVLEFSFLKPEASKKELREFVEAFTSDDDTYLVPEVKNNTDARAYLETVLSKQLSEKAVTAALDELEDESPTALIEQANKQIGFYNEDLKLKNASKADALLNAERSAKKAKEDADRAFSESLQAELKGVEWQDKRKQTVTSYITSGKANQTIKEASLKPKAFLQLADLATYYDPKKEEFDLAAYIKQYASKEIKGIKDNVVKDNFKSAGGKGSSGSITPKEQKLEMLI